MVKMVKGINGERSAGLRPVEVYWMAMYDYNPGWSVPRHAHDFFQLFFVIDGVLQLQTDNGNIEIGRNSFILMPPYAPHALKALSGCPLRTFDIKFSVFPEDLHASLLRKNRPFTDSSGFLKNLLEEIHHEAVMAEPWYRETCNALALQMIVWMGRMNIGTAVQSGVELTTTWCRDQSIRPVLKFIRENYADSNLTLDDIASFVGYAKTYLAKKFRTVVGLSVHRYLMRYRIYEAKSLLRYTAKPIKEVAHLTGFKTIYHFTRVFSDFEQIPPGKWRQWEGASGRKGIAISPSFVNTDMTQGESRPVDIITANGRTVPLCASPPVIRYS